MALRTRNPKKFKEESIKNVEAKIGESKALVFTEYRGMNVAQISELRKKLSEFDTTYAVVRNNFARIAFENAKIDGAEAYFVGPTAIAYIKSEEANSAAKVFFDFMQDVPALVVKGAVVDGELYDAAKIEAYSKLPGKKQLISMFMSALNATTSKFVRAVKAVADKKAENGEA